MGVDHDEAGFRIECADRLRHLPQRYPDTVENLALESFPPLASALQDGPVRRHCFFVEDEKIGSQSLIRPAVAREIKECHRSWPDGLEIGNEMRELALKFCA